MFVVLNWVFRFIPFMPTEKSVSQLSGLLGNLGKLTSIRDTEILEQSLLKTLGPLLGIQDTALYRTDDGQNVVRILFHHRSISVDKDGEARLVESIEEVSDLKDLQPEVFALTDQVRLLSMPCTRRIGGELTVAYPLFGANDIRGYFVFARDEEVSSVEDTTIRGVLEVFSNYYALLDVSQRDRLTGLLNRQALETSFGRIWTALSQPPLSSEERGRRAAEPSLNYWMSVIDIDHFKKVNDNYGHIVGDEVLLLVARLLTQSFRKSDLLYRYGGEEFVAIISADNEGLAAQVFERVRKAIANQPFPRVGKITISTGYCQARPDILPQEVLERADRSLYEAKNQGRNQVCHYADLVRRGILEEASYGDTELF